jgi:hypothetical protein
MKGDMQVEGSKVQEGFVPGLDDRKRIPEEVKADVSAKVVDALVWRSRPENMRSTVARRRAIEMLSLLKEEKVVPHLVSLAFRRVRRNWQGCLEYDHSGIRLAAVQALFAMQEATLEHVRKDPKLSGNEALQNLLKAWLRRDAEQLGERALGNDPEVSALAAFALGTLAKDEEHMKEAALETSAQSRTKPTQDKSQQVGAPVSRDSCYQYLLRAFREHALQPTQTDPEASKDNVMWAIIDSLTLLDPVSVTSDALRPVPEDERRKPYVAYLIGRLGIASTKEGEEVEFLRSSLRSGRAELVGRALRAYAALLALDGSSETRTEASRVRELCHQLVRGRFDALNAEMVTCPPLLTKHQKEKLQYQALGALRDVGNEESIEVLREIRQGDYGAPTEDSVDLNSRLTFDVAEQIYWRISGGFAMQS